MLCKIFYLPFAYVLSYYILKYVLFYNKILVTSSLKLRYLKTSNVFWIKVKQQPLISELIKFNNGKDNKSHRYLI